ncbi:bacteriocin [Ligilactobacillus salivarius]|nr:induction peptide AbpIP family protein [Ligilactobacillus salivarius]MBM6708262.1 bacteriocin [Ligilactobacillus salivarius]OQR07775.1 bacteriocin leader domain-containing protein [Ligilactobacillus salivarius]
MKFEVLTEKKLQVVVGGKQEGGTKAYDKACRFKFLGICK